MKIHKRNKTYVLRCDTGYQPIDLSMVRDSWGNHLKLTSYYGASYPTIFIPKTFSNVKIWFNKSSSRKFGTKVTDLCSREDAIVVYAHCKHICILLLRFVDLEVLSIISRCRD